MGFMAQIRIGSRRQKKKIKEKEQFMNKKKVKE